MKQFNIFPKLIAMFLIATVAFFSACNPSDDPTPTVTGSVIISNEGSFTQGNGSISLFNPIDNIFSNGAFEQANGFPIGSMNSIFVENDRVFMLVQTSGAANDKVEIASVTDFKTQASIQGTGENKVTVPRYALVLNNKLYLTNWGNYDANFNSPNPFILVVDLSSNEIIKRIDLGGRPEFLLEVNNEIWIGQSQSNTIAILDPTTDALKSESITVPNRPKQMQIDANGKVWVSCTGENKLVRIDPTSRNVEVTIDVNVENQSLRDNLAINPAKNTLYIITGESFPSNVRNVFSVPIDSEAGTTINSFISQESIYGMGVDPNDGTVYLGITPDFSSNGTVIRYNPEGQQIDSYAAGIAPKIFVFRNQ